MLNFLKIYMIYRMIYPFYQKEQKIDKCCKLVYNMYYKNNYVEHIRSLKQALNHELVFKNCIQ